MKLRLWSGISHLWLWTDSKYSNWCIHLYLSYCKECSNDKHPITAVLDLPEAHIYSKNHCLKKNPKQTAQVYSNWAIDCCLQFCHWSDKITKLCSHLLPYKATFGLTSIDCSSLQLCIINFLWNWSKVVQFKADLGICPKSEDGP